MLWVVKIMLGLYLALLFIGVEAQLSRRCRLGRRESVERKLKQFLFKKLLVDSIAWVFCRTSGGDGRRNGKSERGSALVLPLLNVEWNVGPYWLLVFAR